MRLHPLSLPLRAVTRGVSLGAAMLFAGTFGGSALDLNGLPVGILFGLVGLGAATAWEVAYYRRFEYVLTADSLDISSGVVSRRHREIPLGRVQNVDIRRTLPARLLGVAVVGLETAGGGRTEAQLRYVGFGEARRLQREIRRLKAGEAEQESPTAADREEAESSLFELSSEDLVVLSLVSVDPRVLSVLVFVGPFLAARMPTTLVRRAVFLLGLLGAVLGLAGLWLSSAVVTFARYYGFRLSRVGDELRYERGLLQRYDGSIPVEKLQTLSIRENPLMRRYGYATLAVETAGYAPGQTPSGGSEAAVPLARRDRVLSLARSIEPFEPGAFERPPKRARRRYVGRYTIAIGLVTAVLYAVDAFLVGVPFPFAPLVLLPLAPVAAHYKWLHRGYHLGDDHVLTRNGFWRRTIKVVPYYRIQTVIERQTVFQRRWRLASVVADTAGSSSIAGGDAVAADLDAETAAALRERLHHRMQDSRRKRRQATWPQNG